MKQHFLPSWSSSFSHCWFTLGASLPEMFCIKGLWRAYEETEDCGGHCNHPAPPPGTHTTLSCPCSHAPALSHSQTNLFSVLTPAKGTPDLHFQRQSLGVCVGAIKSDIKGRLNFFHALVAEDMDFHLIMINCRNSRIKTSVSPVCHLRAPWPKLSHPSHLSC